MKDLEGLNSTNIRIGSKIAPRRDPFEIAVSAGLLFVVVLVCTLLVAVPLLTIILR